MAAKAARQHGFKKTITLFAPYDPTDPASVSKASRDLDAASNAKPGEGVFIISQTEANAHSIPGITKD